ncbi:hypothetical protein BC831DRAFT_275831 [Entophlyctis helioformis]|nr:hypothetical protein BC831DRAFT_275831 [Entophlyctis helioformis]
MLKRRLDQLVQLEHRPSPVAARLSEQPHEAPVTSNLGHDLPSLPPASTATAALTTALTPTAASCTSTTTPIATTTTTLPPNDNQTIGPATPFSASASATTSTTTSATTSADAAVDEPQPKRRRGRPKGSTKSAMLARQMELEMARFQDMAAQQAQQAPQQQMQSSSSGQSHAGIIPTQVRPADRAFPESHVPDQTSQATFDPVPIAQTQEPVVDAAADAKADAEEAPDGSDDQEHGLDGDKRSQDSAPRRPRGRPKGSLKRKFIPTASGSWHANVSIRDLMNQRYKQQEDERRQRRLDEFQFQQFHMAQAADQSQSHESSPDILDPSPEPSTRSDMDESRESSAQPSVPEQQPRMQPAASHGVDERQAHQPPEQQQQQQTQPKRGRGRPKGSLNKPQLQHVVDLMDTRLFPTRRTLAAMSQIQSTQIIGGLPVGSRVEVADAAYTYWPGQVVEARGSKRRITFDGWGSKYDEWIDWESVRVRVISLPGAPAGLRPRTSGIKSHTTATAGNDGQGAGGNDAVDDGDDDDDDVFQEIVVDDEVDDELVPSSIEVFGFSVRDRRRRQQQQHNQKRRELQAKVSPLDPLAESAATAADLAPRSGQPDDHAAQAPAASAAGDDDTQMAASPPTCSICSGHEDPADLHNQIAICDGCGTRYHQKCHTPNIQPSRALDVEQLWFCSDPKCTSTSAASATTATAAVQSRHAKASASKPRSSSSVSRRSAHTVQLPRAGTISRPASSSIFAPRRLVEVSDGQGTWWPGYMLEFRHGRILVRYEGWGPEFDEWIVAASARLRLRHAPTSATVAPATTAASGDSNADETSRVDVVKPSQVRRQHGHARSGTRADSSLAGRLPRAAQAAMQTEPEMLDSSRIVELSPDDPVTSGSLPAVADSQPAAGSQPAIQGQPRKPAVRRKYLSPAIVPPEELEPSAPTLEASAQPTLPTKPVHIRVVFRDPSRDAVERGEPASSAVADCDRTQDADDDIETPGMGIVRFARDAVASVARSRKPLQVAAHATSVSSPHNAVVPARGHDHAHVPNYHDDIDDDEMDDDPAQSKIRCNQCGDRIRQYRYYCTYCEASLPAHQQQQQHPSTHAAWDHPASFNLCLLCFQCNFPFHEHPRSSFAMQPILEVLPTGRQMLPNQTGGKFVTTFEADRFDADFFAALSEGRVPYIGRRVCAFCNDDAENVVGPFVEMPFLASSTSKTSSTSTARVGGEAVTETALVLASAAGTNLGKRRKKVFWVHVACARFSPEVHVSGEGRDAKWYNVLRAVRRGRNMRCTACKGKGATIGCFDVKCMKSYHLACTGKPLSHFEQGILYWCPTHEAFLNRIDVYEDVYSCDVCAAKLGQDENDSKPWHTCQVCMQHDYYTTFDLCLGCFENAFPSDHAHGKADFSQTTREGRKEANAQERQRIQDMIDEEAQRADQSQAIMMPKNRSKRKPQPLKQQPRDPVCAFCWSNCGSSWRRGFNGMILCEACFLLAPASIRLEINTDQLGSALKHRLKTAHEAVTAAFSSGNPHRLAAPKPASIFDVGSRCANSPDSQTLFPNPRGEMVLWGSSAPQHEPSSDPDERPSTHLGSRWTPAVTDALAPYHDQGSESSAYGIGGLGANAFLDPIILQDPIARELIGLADYEAYDVYMTRKAARRPAEEEAMGTAAMTPTFLSTYAPQDDQLFSLFMDSTYYDVPGRAPRWATHSGSDYHGTWLPQLVRWSLLRYTQRGDRVLSNFIGRGTDAIESFLLERRCCAVDINPVAVALAQRNASFFMPPSMRISAVYRPMIVHGDSRNLTGPLFESESYAHVLSHPPYKDCVAYSSHIDGDLSRFPDPAEFQSEMARVVAESWRLLKWNGRVTLGIGDNRRDCYYQPISYQTIRTYMDGGFEIEELVRPIGAGCGLDDWRLTARCTVPEAATALSNGAARIVSVDAVRLSHVHARVHRRVPQGTQAGRVSEHPRVSRHGSSGCFQA